VQIITANRHAGVVTDRTQDHVAFLKVVSVLAMKACGRNALAFLIQNLGARLVSGHLQASAA